MSNRNIRQWLAVSNEDNEPAVVIVQESETPKEDMSVATNVDTTDIEVAAPAVAEIPAASEGVPDQKVIDQGHQETRISVEDAAPECGSEEVAPETITTDKPVEPTDVAEVKVEAPVVATIEPAPAGDEQETPKSDDQVEAKPIDTEVNVISNEEAEVLPLASVVDQTVTAVVEDTPVGDVTVDITPTPEGGATVEVTIATDTGEADTPVDPVEAAVYAADAAGDEEAISEVQEQIEDVQDDIDNFTKVSAAMEAYQRILVQGIDSGSGISVETAEAIRLGMESLDQWFADEPCIVSNEEFGGTSTNLTATKVSLEDFKSKFAQVVEATRRALAKLFDILYELWTALTGGAERALKRLGTLKDRIKGLSKDSVDHVVTVNGVGRLSVGALFEGNNAKSVSDIATVARYMYKDYPDQITSFAREANGIYADLIPGKNDAPDQIRQKIAVAMQAFLGLPKGNLKAIPGSSPASNSELPPSLQRFDGVSRSKVLAGNYALLQFIAPVNATKVDSAAAAASSIATIFNQIFNVQFVQLTGQPAAHPSESYKLPSKRELQQVADELEGLLKMTIASASNTTKYKAVKDSIEKTVTKIITESKMVNTDDSYMPTIFNPMVVSLLNLSKLLTQPSGQFNGYVVSVCNAYVGLLGYNLEQFEAELKKAA